MKKFLKKSMNNIFGTSKKIKNLIAEASAVLLVCHQNPDGDALGSLCAFMNYFEAVGKKYRAFCSGRISSSFLFLPGIEKISTDFAGVKLLEYDLIIILDAGDFRQTGLEEQFNGLLDLKEAKGLRQPVIVNIDHHLTNEYFGDVNLVIESASSTAEIIYENFKDVIRIDREIATALLLGIFTDTGHFSNPATTISSLEVASSLLQKGARMRLIVDNVLKNKSVFNLKIWGKIFSRLIKNKKLGLVVALISYKDFSDNEFDEEAVEGLTNFLNHLENTKAVLVLREKEGEIKGSLRTTTDSIDVSRLARLFGGGGHQRAAGFTIKGSFRETADGWRVM